MSDPKPIRQFLLNYGGVGAALTTDPKKILSVMKESTDYYGEKVALFNREVKGIHVKVLGYSVHRAVYFAITKANPSEASQQLLLALLNTAYFFARKDYHLLENNCVTAVATVLNQLDQNLTEPDLVLPWILDRRLNQYYGEYDESIAPFVKGYQNEVNNGLFTFFTGPNWNTKKVINNADDIVDSVFDETDKELSGSTNNLLLKLDWLQKNDNGTLLPTEKSPESLRAAFEAHNERQNKGRTINSSLAS